jgi:hypothetical protein
MMRALHPLYLGQFIYLATDELFASQIFGTTCVAWSSIQASVILPSEITRRHHKDGAPPSCKGMVATSMKIAFQAGREVFEGIE